MKQQILKSVIAQRLDKQLHTDLGEKGLNTLIYGWTRNNENLRVAIAHRNWLYDYEVQELSIYAGYDLLKMES